MQILGVFSRRSAARRATSLAACLGLLLAIASPIYALAPRAASPVRASSIETVGAPRSIATGDFDSDGIPDVAIGYSSNVGGSIAIFRGNPDAIFPNSPEAQQRRAQGTGTSEALLPSPTILDIPASADFLAAGDFNSDGAIDLVTAARGGTSLVELLGGQNGFGEPVERALDGSITALAAGDFGLHGHATSIAVGLSNDAGERALVFQSWSNALDADATSLNVSEPIVSLAFANDAVGLGVLAIGAGSRMTVASPPSFERASLETSSYDLGARALSLAMVPGAVAVVDDAGVLHSFHPSRAGDWQDDRSPVSLAGTTAIVSAGLGVAALDPVAESVRAIDSAVASKRSDPGQVFDSAPIATVAMRLNADAIPDFVTITAGSTTPVVTVSKTAMTYTVTNADDMGAGSLGQAIIDANTNAGTDEIDFTIPGADFSIDLASPLPAITEAVTIDGTTQTGFAGSPIVELNGAGAGASTNGLTITGGATTIRGLIINRFTAAGIAVNTAGNVNIEGNYIGTGAAGLSDQGNGTDGVQIAGVANVGVGGTVAASRNVISGNDSDGVQIDGTGATTNIVAGNYIGTGANGSAAIANAQNGVTVGTLATANTIGGATASSQNVISGNTLHGVSFPAADGTANTVQNNRIGTNAADNGAIANGVNGVSIGSNGNSITSNRIATNGGVGVFVATGVGNSISTNSISGNASLGIDLAPVGVTPNDTNDADSGPNNLQNFPVLASAQSQGASTVVTGTLSSTSATLFRIEFYENASCDASGNGEGMTFIGFANVTTSAQGVAAINATLPVAIATGQTLTAIAIDPNGNTSEFSACTAVAVSADLAITKTGLPTSVPTGNNLTYTITVTNLGPLTAQNVQVFDAIPSGTVFLSTTQSQGTCDTPPVNGTGALLCALGTINATSAVTITLVVKVTGPAGLTITNTAFVQSTTPDSNGDNNTVTASTLVIAPPQITSITKASGDTFKININGSNFQPGVQVFIGADIAPWPNVKYKSSTALTLRKGGTLKDRFPKNVPVSIRVVNPDGGEATATFTR